MLKCLKERDHKWIEADLVSTNIELNKRLDALSIETSLLQLVVLNKITATEMSNLLKMLVSPDEENHVVAKETISNLITNLTKEL